MSGTSLQVSEQSDDHLTKILISNLEFGVTVEDIKELFSEFGRILRGVVNYDKSGRSLGTAEVTFGRRVEAIRALQHYNGKFQHFQILGMKILEYHLRSSFGRKTDVY